MKVDCFGLSLGRINKCTYSCQRNKLPYSERKIFKKKKIAKQINR
jgi:hypothetical protein